MATPTIQKEGEHEEIDVGIVLAAWDAFEFTPADRSKQWYMVAGAIGLFMLLYALFTANFVFALIVVMFAVIMLMQDIKKPDRVKACVTTMGVVFGQAFYPYSEIKDFSIAYNPPDVKYLYIGFNSKIKPMLSIPLEGSNPNKVREALLPYAFENLKREGESLTDTLRRVYKL
jgi:hypothetical protein